jgi:sterol desaturase/sphingolipid hydroxylase (fatty acid hydroxylase superfamily)
VVRDFNTGLPPMLAETLAVAKVAGETMLKLVPISIAFGIIFGVLTHWSACNPGRPWWRKREIVTDICYWFLIPLAARFVRIGFMVMGAAYIYGIHGADALINFYDDGFGPLAKMPLWAQAVTFLVVSDFLTYWIHRGFHGGGLWKYHAVHHSSEELDWISAARFHPVNIFFGTVLVDAGLLLAGISPNVMLWVGPLHDGFVRIRARQSELDARALQIRHCRASLPPLAPYCCGSRRIEELCRHLSDMGSSVRHVLYACAQASGRVWH